MPVIRDAFSQQAADNTQWADTIDWTARCDWLQVARSRIILRIFIHLGDSINIKHPPHPKKTNTQKKKVEKS